MSLRELAGGDVPEDELLVRKCTLTSPGRCTPFSVEQWKSGSPWCQLVFESVGAFKGGPRERVV